MDSFLWASLVDRVTAWGEEVKGKSLLPWSVLQGSVQGILSMSMSMSMSHLTGERRKAVEPTHERNKWIEVPWYEDHPMVERRKLR